MLRSPEHRSRPKAGAAALERERGGDAVKALTEAHGTEGPGRPIQPERPQPQDFQRPYDAAGHGAQSPMTDPPHSNPVPHAPPGVVQPIQLPGGPLAARIGPAVAAGLAMGSPSERAR